MLLSQLLQTPNLNAQLFAFFNTRFSRGEKDFKTKFCIRSLYRESKFFAPNPAQMAEFSRQSNENLRAFSSLPFECEKFGEHKVSVKNDLNLSFDDYANALYSNILRLRRNGDEREFERAL